VQFYFALGLILMGGVVIRFVIWGGEAGDQKHLERDRFLPLLGAAFVLVLSRDDAQFINTWR